MKKLYHFVPVLVLLFGLPGAFGDVLVLEGKTTVTANSGKESAPFLVEGTVFQMTGDALTAFAKENGPGDYIIQVEGDFDVKAQKVAATRIVLKQKL